ncbi:MAG TPA: hypothetical protein VHW09_02230 [Bryobacteraceae bacterium]|jgi:hypothetical protein|nr:hypothetical protein [Bryobacteraceae bacterium]
MRALIVLPLWFAFAATAQSPSPVSGRWEGNVEIPGGGLRLVIDLAPRDSGHWIGSATVPGFGVKGAPLAALEVTDQNVSFTIAGVLGDPKVKAEVSGDGLKGEFAQAGNSANFTLHKTGVAQVDLPRTSTLVEAELEGQWDGSVMYAGSPLHVKLTLQNGEKAASATLVFSRTKETAVTVTLVTQEDSRLSVEADGGQVNMDGRVDAASGELRGTLAIGGTEMPMALRKGSGK